MFSHIIGNEAAKRYLTSMVDKNAIAQSMLFAGPDGIGKSLFAEAFAKLVICQNDPTGIHKHKLDSNSHPDLRIYRPEGKIGMHSIDSLRHFNEEVYLPPYEADRKIFIIHDADRMLSYSANALLKTFEEPASHSIIILLSSSPDALLPTVLSRCTTIRLKSVSTEDIADFLINKFNKTPEDAQQIAIMARGSLGEAVHLVEQNGNKLRQRVLSLFAQERTSLYHELIESAKEISGIIEQEQKEIEESSRAAILKSFPDGLTSMQQQAIEKEIEGSLAMRQMQEAHAVFDIILCWYRDMHLLNVNGNRNLLFHADFRDEIEQSLQRGEMLPLETVQQAVAQAQLALDRSTSIANCLENLFLKLRMQ